MSTSKSFEWNHHNSQVVWLTRWNIFEPLEPFHRCRVSFLLGVVTSMGHLETTSWWMVFRFSHQPNSKKGGFHRIFERTKGWPSPTFNDWETQGMFSNFRTHFLMVQWMAQGASKIRRPLKLWEKGYTTWKGSMALLFPMYWFIMNPCFSPLNLGVASG